MPVDASVRLFLALCPPSPVCAALADHVAAWRWNADARRHAPTDWHVTLHFLGAVPRARIDELRAGLVVPMAPFTLRFGQPLLWPQGLAVLLLTIVPPELMRLHAALGQAVRALALKTDARPYRPHLTLARHAAKAEPPAQAQALVFDWPVRGYALMASTGDAAQRYRVLQTYGAAA
jgi:2'-5' RNA ligase